MSIQELCVCTCMMTGEVTELTELSRVNTCKAAGPDSVPAHVLRVCADRLVGDVQVVVPVSRVLCFRPLPQQSDIKCFYRLFIRSIKLDTSLTHTIFFSPSCTQPWTKRNASYTVPVKSFYTSTNS